MLAIVWVFRILAIPFGVVCMLVALDVLHIWGFEGRRRSGSRRGAPLPPAARPGVSLPGSPRSGRYSGPRPRPEQTGARPHPDAWIWWQGRIRHPAFLLLLLGAALIGIGVLLYLPGYGYIPWLSEHIVPFAVLLFGLVLLRGTLKISSPLLWRRITIIKWPWGGRARPSFFWMACGLALCVVSLYGIVRELSVSAAALGGGLGRELGPVLAMLAILAGCVLNIGLEGILQAWLEKEPVPLPSFLTLGIGFLGVIIAVVGGVAF